MQFLALLAAALLQGVPAEGDHQPDIAVALTDDVVQITSDFAGARLVLFGAAQESREGDNILVIVRGPEVPILVMQKERRAGIWMNSNPANFAGAPAYYAVAGTRALDQVATPDVLRSLGAGVEHLALTTVGEGSAERTPQIADYRRAIVRLKERDGLYRSETGPVEILEGGLFRAEVRLPAKAPVGTYAANVYLMRGGALLAQNATTLRVEKAGIERVVTELAMDHPFIYGVLAVLMALVAGWLAAVSFSRR